MRISNWQVIMTPSCRIPLFRQRFFFYATSLCLYLSKFIEKLNTISEIKEKITLRGSVKLFPNDGDYLARRVLCNVLLSKKIKNFNFGLGQLEWFILMATSFFVNFRNF